MYRDIDRNLQFPGFWVGKPEDDVAVIIDGAYLAHTSRYILKGGIEFKTLSWILFANLAGLRSVEYFVTEIFRETEETRFKHGLSNIRGRLLWMKNNRYTVHSHPVYVAQDTEIDYQRLETQMDVQITSALYKAARFAQHIVFIGGSRRFIDPLLDLKSLGKTITVVGVKRSDLEGADVRSSVDEIRQIDNFVDLEDPFFEQIITKRKPSIPDVGVPHSPEDNPSTELTQASVE